jgi:uncharacterized protein (DUF1684 family)
VKSPRRASFPVIHLFLLLFLSAAAFSACSRPAAGVDENLYRQEIERWRGERLKSLTGEGSWLTLAGLFWLKEGENRMGSDPASDIVLPEGKAPARAGSLWLERGAVRLEAAPDSAITREGQPVSTLDLKSDADGEPTVLNLGSLSFQVIKRGESLGLRVKDSEHPERKRFAGLDYFPAEPKWRVEARFEPYNPPKMVPIMNVLGMTEDQPSPGALVFEVGGQSYRLDAISEKGSEELFIIFADLTSGKQTYGAGRYLYTAPADGRGRVVLDFNKAYNPPCAFTNYATCPLPPAQNRLALSVEAGEKNYTQSAH